MHFFSPAVPVGVGLFVGFGVGFGVGGVVSARRVGRLSLRAPLAY